MTPQEIATALSSLPAGHVFGEQGRDNHPTRTPSRGRQASP
ncbi:hypothetical protein LCGC14_1883310 [marine sediment metagenome]|uniref:Uncharacterized protein n=1 Tax=marine sediment metagenome TaxID=412755 RepID=A0A0F9G1I2_9ZZZZ